MNTIIERRMLALNDLKERRPVLFRHFKGGLYKATGVARDTESGNVSIIYTNADKDTGEYFSRPIDSFFALADKSKYPMCQQQYRFEVVKNTLEE